MIPKSLSRKTPSFNQLIAYMHSDKADERFELYQHCFARGEAALAREFFANSELLGKRKNGNYLYHEILSITIEDGVDRSHAKACLRELALRYVGERCPGNMVYGCLHDDHEGHIHYHLMISANECGESRRLRLSKGKFDEIKRELETHTLEQYPELKQRRIITAEREEKKLSRKAAEVKRKGGKLERQDFVRRGIHEAMVASRSMDEFRELLLGKQFEYYQRGKHHGVSVTHPDGRQEKYRFATLGIAADFEMYQESLERLSEAQKHSEKPEQGKEGQQRSEGKSRATETPKRGPHPEADKERGEDMSRDREDRLKKPSLERQELIDKGHVQPDPERDLMSHEDWKAQDKFSTKVQQSWRRTMDDFRGRTKDLEDRARGKGDDDGERER
jgi:hypothetical protein